MLLKADFTLGGQTLGCKVKGFHRNGKTATRVVTCFPVAIKTPENYQELSFYQQDDGTYLVACGTSKYLSKIIIPDTYKGAAVVGICERAFQPPSKSGSGYTMYEKTYLESIVIPNSITSIGNSAFYYCTSLETIEFEGTVEQWNAIEKGGNWNYYVSATEVICSDGVVPLN